MVRARTTSTRLTASIGFDGAVGSRPLSATLAWGENREDNGFNEHRDGYLLEWDLRAADDRAVLRPRRDSAKQDLFGLGLASEQASRIRTSYLAHRARSRSATSATCRSRRDGHASASAPTSRVYRMSADSSTSSTARDRFTSFLRWRPGARQPRTCIDDRTEAFALDYRAT